PETDSSILVAYIRRSSSGRTSLCSRAGYSSYVRPSSILPALAFLTPPHCLKKKGTAARRHCSLRDMTHSFFITLAPAPLSPPTITHEMPCKLMEPRSSSSGSIDRNDIRADASRRCPTRGTPCFLFSTLTPHQMWHRLAANFRGPCKSWFRRSARFVST